MRNNVWLALWDDEEGHIQQCFRTRLNTYRPSLIINACTNSLTRRVTDFLQHVELEVEIEIEGEGEGEEWPIYLYKAYHPAMHWNNTGNFGLQPIPPANQNAVDPQQ